MRTREGRRLRISAVSDGLAAEEGKHPRSRLFKSYTFTKFVRFYILHMKLTLSLFYCEVVLFYSFIFCI